MSTLTSEASHDYVSPLRLSSKEVGVAGTLVGPRNRERLVEVWGFDVDMEPSAHMVFFRYVDRPGIVGIIGGKLGDAGVNIATMQVGRREAGGEALIAMAVDGPVPADVVDEIAADIDAADVRAIDQVLRGPGQPRADMVKIAVAPETSREWIRDAVRAGGAEIVPPDEASALVWTDTGYGRRDGRRARGPQADPRRQRADRVGAAAVGGRGAVRSGGGVRPRGATWTCGKGVYAPPVAEHALALGLAGLRNLKRFATALSGASSPGSASSVAP